MCSTKLPLPQVRRARCRDQPTYTTTTAEKGHDAAISVLSGAAPESAPRSVPRHALYRYVLVRRRPPSPALNSKVSCFVLYTTVQSGRRNIIRTPLVVRRVPCIFRLHRIHRKVPPPPPELGDGLAVGTVVTPSPGRGERGDRSDPHEQAWVRWVRWERSSRLLTLTGFRMMDGRSGAPDIR